jgi:hypothetical protein
MRTLSFADIESSKGEIRTLSADDIKEETPARVRTLSFADIESEAAQPIPAEPESTQAPIMPTFPTLLPYARNVPVEDTIVEKKPLMGAGRSFDTGVIPAFKGGAKESILGKAIRLAGKKDVFEPYTPEGFIEELAHSVGVIAPDLPFFFAGGAIGAGTKTASATWQALSRMGGAFGFVQGLHKVFQDKYDKGEVKSVKDFVNRLSDTAKETVKGELIGMATAMGGMVGKPVAEATKFYKGHPKITKHIVGKYAPTTARLAGEIGALTTASAGMEGRLPSIEDFQHTAPLILLLHSVGGTAQGIRAKLKRISEKTGKSPNEIIEEVTGMPLLKPQEIEPGYTYKPPEIKTTIRELPEAPIEVKHKAEAIRERWEAQLEAAEGKIGMPLLKPQELEPGSYKPEATKHILEQLKKPREAIEVKPGEAKGITSELQTVYEKITKAVKREAPEEVRREVQKTKDIVLTPTKGNALDKANTVFLRTEDVKQFFDAMPAIGELSPKEIVRFDKELGKTIATLDKNKPALRQSGFYALQEFADSLAKVKDISKLDAMWADPIRLMQGIDQGRFGGPVQQHILWPAHRSILAKLRWVDIGKSKLAEWQEKWGITSGKKNEVVGDVIEFINEKTSKIETSKLLQNKELSQYLTKFKPDEQIDIVAGAKELRVFFNQLLEQQNIARRLRKQDPIKFRENYRPWIIKANLWNRLAGLKQRPKEIMESPEMPDFIFPNKPFNPRAEARVGLLGKYPKERNITRLMSDYIETAAKDIFDTNVVHHNKIYAAVLRSRGCCSTLKRLSKCGGRH